MKKTLLIVMLIVAVGLVGCPRRYYDGDRRDQDRGHDYDRDRHDQDRGHGDEHHDNDNQEHR